MHYDHSMAIRGVSSPLDRHAYNQIWRFACGRVVMPRVGPGLAHPSRLIRNTVLTYTALPHATYAGIDDPYEEPDNAEIVIEVSKEDGILQAPDVMAKTMLSYLESKGIVPGK